MIDIVPVRTEEMKEFTVKTDDCNGRVRLYMNGESVKKIVVMFPRANKHQKVLTLDPKELLLIAELTNSLDKNSMIDPVLNDIEQKVVPIMHQNKIMAIKELRYITALGLKEAKDEVEYMMNYGFEQWKKLRRPRMYDR